MKWLWALKVRTAATETEGICTCHSLTSPSLLVDRKESPPRMHRSRIAYEGNHIILYSTTYEYVLIYH